MRIFWTVLVCLALLPLNAIAREKEGEKEKEDGYERAARKYEQRSRVMARRAQKQNDPGTKAQFISLSEKYSLLAKNKREARAAETSGKKYDWSQYEQTRKEVDRLLEEIKPQRGRDEGDKGKPAKQDKEGPEASKERHQPGKDKKDPPPAADGKEKQEEKDGEKTVGDKPEAKTFQTESGFLIRTSL